MGDALAEIVAVDVTHARAVEAACLEPADRVIKGVCDRDRIVVGGKETDLRASDIDVGNATDRRGDHETPGLQQLDQGKARPALEARRMHEHVIARHDACKVATVIVAAMQRDATGEPRIVDHSLESPGIGSASMKVEANLTATPGE